VKELENTYEIVEKANSYFDNKNVPACPSANEEEKIDVRVLEE
jgi:hypothetical protein